MIQISSDSAGSVLGVKFVGKVSDTDIKDLIVRAEAIIAAEGKVRLIGDVTEFDGWAWQAAYDKTAFGIKHWGDIEKMAVVTDSRWENLAATIADKLMKAEVRHFTGDGYAEAWSWIKAD